MMPRGRNYTHIAVDFLTKGVHETDNDDWQKLQQLLLYLCGTIYIPLILRDVILNVTKWWVYALYGLHGDTRENTGSTMYVGCRSAFSMSKNKK